MGCAGQCSLRRADILIATVDTGEVNAALTATGSATPAREAVRTGPIPGTIWRAAPVVGTRVAPGPLILELAAPDRVGLPARTGLFPAQRLGSPATPIR